MFFHQFIFRAVRTHNGPMEQAKMWPTKNVQKFRVSFLFFLLISLKSPVQSDAADNETLLLLLTCHCWFESSFSSFFFLFFTLYFASNCLLALKRCSEQLPNAVEYNDIARCLRAIVPHTHTTKQTQLPTTTNYCRPQAFR